MLLNPNQTQTDQSQTQPQQTDPNQLPEEKKEADLRNILQAIAIKEGRRLTDAKILKIAPRDKEESKEKIPNPFRDRKG